MKISVVIPTYNHSRFLRDSITSALAQTYRPHEVIVVDDGSTDQTRAVVAEFPVRYIYQENAGLSAARNTGITQATGDWIALLDADDWWLPEKLQLQARALGQAEFCYCATTRYFPDGHTEDAEYFPAEMAKKLLRHHNFIDPSSVVAKRDLLLKVGGFKVGMPAGEDWEMWLKLAPICEFVGVPDRLLAYRVTGTGMSANPEIFMRSMEDIVSAGTAGLPPIQRFIEAQRMRSVRSTLVAVKYRQIGDHKNALRYAKKAVLYWPSPFYDKAYKVLLVEIWNRLKFRP